LEQSSPAEVVGDDTGARGQTRLHPGPRPQSSVPGIAREQSGSDHDQWIRRVRARGDRRDGDVPVTDSPSFRGLADPRFRFGRTGCLTLVSGLVPAGMLGLEERVRDSGDLAQLDPILGATGAGEAGRDLTEIDGDLSVEADRAGRIVPQSLLFRVLLDEVDVPTGAARVGEEV